MWLEWLSGEQRRGRQKSVRKGERETWDAIRGFRRLFVHRKRCFRVLSAEMFPGTLLLFFFDFLLGTLVSACTVLYVCVTDLTFVLNHFAISSFYCSAFSLSLTPALSLSSTNFYIGSLIIFFSLVLYALLSRCQAYPGGGLWVDGDDEKWAPRKSKGRGSERERERE